MKNKLTTVNQPNPYSIGFRPSDLKKTVEKDNDFWYRVEKIGYEFPKPKNDNLHKNIAGFTISLPYSLSHIFEEIDYSTYILDIDDDSFSINTTVYLASLSFLQKYSICLHGEGVIIDSPEINPCSNGSIDLSWRVNKVRLLINFFMSPDNNNKVVAQYYSDCNEPMTERKGFINLDHFDYSFAEWMKILKRS